VACGSYPKEHNFKKEEAGAPQLYNPYFSDLAKDYVYKAQITFAQKSFGGIFVVKKLGQKHHRVVFTTEMGNKILDFSFIENEFKINFILKKINKKVFINLLKKDFFALINENPKVVGHYKKQGDITLFESRIKNDTYFYLHKDQHLTKILKTGQGKEKVTYIFLETENTHAKEIRISHNNRKLKIFLKAI
jgi:hypothetical protein